MEPTATEPYDPGMNTQAAIEALEQRLADPSCRVDTILINVGTLIRNRNRKEAKISILMDEVQQDVVTIANRLANTLKPKAQKVVPSVIFYIGDYFNSIDRDFLRSAPPSIATYVATWVHLYKTIVHGSSHVNGIDIVEAKLKPSRTIYLDLLELVRKQQTTRTIVMLSHVAIDYHIAKWYPNMEVVQSRTGKFLTPKDFAMKVFGREEVPFFPCTHAVLGDKELIRGSLGIKEKRQMYEIATEEKWQFHTEQFVKDSMIKHGFLKKGVRYPLI